MSNIDIIRAWKDEEYRNSLSEEEQSQLPENPAGMMKLLDADMECVVGGAKDDNNTASAGECKCVSIDTCPPKYLFNLPSYNILHTQNIVSTQ